MHFAKSDWIAKLLHGMKWQIGVNVHLSSPNPPMSGTDQPEILQVFAELM